MIRKCVDTDFRCTYAIINDAARVYQGVIPADRWHDPYMPESELTHEIAQGVEFWGCEEQGVLVGVMGIQNVKDVTLIRHAYVACEHQHRGVGSRLLSHLRQKAEHPILIGTWAAATWAIEFYQKHGFVLVSEEEKNRLLKKYWTIPERQIETSVVLKNGLKPGGVSAENIDVDSDVDPL